MTTNQTAVAPRVGSADYAVTLCQYSQYCSGNRCGSSVKMKAMPAGGSAAYNASMYSVIESCKLNDMDPGKYLRHLLNKLKSHKEGDDLRNLLPCYCTL